MQRSRVPVVTAHLAANARQFGSKNDIRRGQRLWNFHPRPMSGQEYSSHCVRISTDGGWFIQVPRFRRLRGTSALIQSAAEYCEPETNTLPFLECATEKVAWSSGINSYFTVGGMVARMTMLVRILEHQCSKNEVGAVDKARILAKSLRAGDAMALDHLRRKLHPQSEAREESSRPSLLRFEYRKNVSGCTSITNVHLLLHIALANQSEHTLSHVYRARRDRYFDLGRIVSVTPDQLHKGNISVVLFYLPDGSHGGAWELAKIIPLYRALIISILPSDVNLKRPWADPVVVSTSRILSILWKGLQTWFL